MGSVNSTPELINEQGGEDILSALRDIGQILARARKEKNLTIEQVAAQIYIRQRYLQDLEKGDFSDLPGRVYILGFIRTYARLLNLDGGELVRRLSIVSDLPEQKHDPLPITKLPQENPNFLTLIGSGVLILLVAIGGYIFLKPSSSSSNVTNTTSIDQSSQVQEPLLDAELLSKPTEIQSPSLELPKSLPSQTLPQSFQPTTPPVTTNLASSNAEKSDLKEGSFLPNRVMVKANAPSWIEVRDEDSNVVFMKVLKNGEEFVVPETGVHLNTGNAGGIDIFVSGVKLPALGALGEVKRDIRLKDLQSLAASKNPG